MRDEQNDELYAYTKASMSKTAAGAQLLKNVYWWMTGALAITGLTSLLVISHPEWIVALFTTKGLMIGLCVAEFVLVLIISAAINKLSAVGATLLFVLYSVLNGVTLSSILLVYTMESVVGTFFMCAGMFAGMAIFGSVTKKDLSSWGRFLLMALIGLIIASIINIFLQSSTAYWIISVVGVVLFAGLTAYDAQKIQAMLRDADEVTETTQKIALLGALTLYLDFINLFIYLIRIFGRRN